MQSAVSARAFSTCVQPFPRGPPEVLGSGLWLPEIFSHILREPAWRARSFDGSPMPTLTEMLVDFRRRGGRHEIPETIGVAIVLILAASPPVCSSFLDHRPTRRASAVCSAADSAQTSGGRLRRNT
jgi:hypothetical protein